MRSSATLRSLATLSALAVLPVLLAGQTPEAIWYVRNDSAGIASFVANARHISIIAPQVYSIDSAGTIRGGTDPRIVAAARANGVKLHPLVMNPGFDLRTLHRIVADPTARTASARSLADALPTRAARRDPARPGEPARERP